MLAPYSNEDFELSLLSLEVQNERERMSKSLTPTRSQPEIRTYGKIYLIQLLLTIMDLSTLVSNWLMKFANLGHPSVCQSIGPMSYMPLLKHFYAITGHSSSHVVFSVTRCCSPIVRLDVFASF